MSKGKLVTMQTKNTIADTRDMSESTDHYHDLLKTNPLNQKAYARLMQLYRRSKDFKKELQVIESAIKAFESLYSTRKIKDTKITKVSKQLNLAFGLTDKNGKMLYEQEPVITWKKRKKIVLNKLLSRK